MSESVILCEGYYDRAFWAGWLKHLGCGKPDSNIVHDPKGSRVTGGQYGYYTPTGQFVRVVPCHGKPNIRDEARRRLEGREADELARLVISVDSDEMSDGTQAASPSVSDQSIEELVHRFDPDSHRTGPGRFLLDDGAVEVCVVHWRADDEPADDLPNQQTLERLVCAVLRAVYPERAAPVQAWLGSRPGAQAPGPKEFAWSHMAGWYAEGGCQFFYERMWEDPKIVSELEARLRDAGAWQIAQALAR